MRAVAVVRALGPVDLKSVARDPLLAWMLLVPLLLGLAVRWLLPGVTAWTLEAFDLRLEAYYPLIASYLVVLLAPSIAGMIIGFLLLDERDDRTLTALLVTPLAPSVYLAYRLGIPLVACTAVALVAFPVDDLVEITWQRLLPVVIVAAMEAPLWTLALASFAENKVQGFALTKGLGLVLSLPMLAYFLGTPWETLLALVPSYWPLKAFWLAGAPSSQFWVFVAAGFALHLALLFALLRRFRRVLYR